MRHSSHHFVMVAFLGLAVGNCVPSPAPAPLAPPFDATAGAELVVLGDLNNDGLIDVVSVAGESQPIQVHLRNFLTLGFDTFTIAGGAPLARVNDLELADMNGDGGLDIVALINDTGFLAPEGAPKEGSVGILFQGADPRNPTDWTQIPAPGRSPPVNLSFPSSDSGATDLAVGDVDGSNGPDIVILSNETDAQRVRLFRNPGPEATADQTAWSSVVIEQDASDLAAVELVDLDGDGDLDVVMSVPVAKSFNLRWLENPRIREVIGGPPPFPTFESQQVDPVLESSAGPKATAVGDINHDGYLDIASVWDESQPVQIHLYDPDTGGFNTRSIAGGALLSRAIDIELVDLDGDGRLDIAVLVHDTGIENCGPGTIDPDGCPNKGALVLLIQGDDPLAPADWIQVPRSGAGPPENLLFSSNGTGVTDMVIGEVDGLPGSDIVIVSNESDLNRVHLYANPGADRVTDPTAWVKTWIEQDLPRFARAELADLDEDGDLDVVMTAPDGKSYNVRWLQNPLIELTPDDPNPVPTFVPQFVDPLFEATAGAKATVMGDLDGDGLLDIASVSEESQPVQIHLRNAVTGDFETISIAGGAPIARANGIAMADLNGDGKLDLVVLINDTSFATLTAWQQDKVGALVFLLQGADPREPSDWTQVDFLRQPGSCFVEEPGPECGLMFPSNETGVVDMAVGDFNNDGLADVVVVNNRRDKQGEATKHVYLLLNPGPGLAADASQWVSRLIHADIPEMTQIEAADLDRDGNLDLVLTVPEAKSFNIRWLRNVGGAVVFFEELVGQHQGGADLLTLGDVDGDGNIDVLVASVAQKLTQWFRNPGPAALAPGRAQVPWLVYTIGMLDEGDIEQVHLVDLDNNGTLDCFLTASGVGYGFRRQDDVQHVWERFPIFRSDPEATIGTVSFADIDGDGRLDFVAPFNREGLLNDRFVLYRSVAASLWHRRLVGQQQGGGDFLAVGDLDGDGHLDVSVASIEHKLTQWFRNPGPADLALNAPQVPWEVFNIGTLGDGDINQIRLVDLDNDGRLNCLVTASGRALGYRAQADVERMWDPFLITVSDPPGEIERVSFGDFDADGKLDFVAPVDRPGLIDDELLLYRSASASLWHRRLIGQQHGGANFIALADVDRDGNVDVAAASADQGVAQWFRNPGPTLLATPGTQAPWDVYTIGSLANVKLAGEPQSGEVNQIQLVDLDGDGRLDCFLTASGMAFEFIQGHNARLPWPGQVLFKTDPPGVIGRVGFIPSWIEGWMNIIVPVNREGVTQDQIVVFQR